MFNMGDNDSDTNEDDSRKEKRRFSDLSSASESFSPPTKQSHNESHRVEHLKSTPLQEDIKAMIKSELCVIRQEIGGIIRKEFRDVIREDVKTLFTEFYNSARFNGELNTLVENKCTEYYNSDRFNGKLNTLVENKCKDIINLNVMQLLEPINEKLSKLEDEVQHLESHNSYLEHTLEELEMYGRRNSIRIYGIPEMGPNENCVNTCLQVFRKELRINWPFWCIGRAHRVPRKFESNKPRPIICRFVRHDNKDDVLKRFNQVRRNIRIFIKEDLTSKRAKLSYDVQSLPGVKSSNSRDGKISCVLDNGQMVRNISSIDDVRSKLFINQQEDETATGLGRY